MLQKGDPMSRSRSRSLHTFLVSATALLGLVSGLAPGAAHAQRYVRPDGVDSGDCSSPAAPCATIGYAVDHTVDWDVVRVARGIYTSGATVGIGASYLTIQGGWSRDFTWQDLDPSVTVLDGAGITCTLDAGSSLTLERLTIQNAAIAVRLATGHCGTTLEAVVLRGNETAVSAYVLYVVVVNSQIVENGTGLLFSGGEQADLAVRNSTIAGNAKGVDLFSMGWPPWHSTTLHATCTNSIINGNTSVDVELRRNSFGTCTFDASNSDIGLITNVSEPPSTYTAGPGMIDQDPGFVGPADYHLAAGSACVDTGSNDSMPADDGDGEPRPFDGDGDGRATVDMGADEYWPFPAGPLLFWDDFESGTASAWSWVMPYSVARYRRVAAVSRDAGR
jgi:hypothetical protein